MTGAGALIGGWGGPLSSSPPQTGGENRSGRERGCEVPACAGMTEEGGVLDSRFRGNDGYPSTGEGISKNDG